MFTEKKKRERRKEKKNQAVKLYIFLMEGDTVGALRINLDAWMESWSAEKMANIAVAQWPDALINMFLWSRMRRGHKDFWCS